MKGILSLCFLGAGCAMVFATSSEEATLVSDANIKEAAETLVTKFRQRRETEEDDDDDVAMSLTELIDGAVPDYAEDKDDPFKPKESAQDTASAQEEDEIEKRGFW